MKPPGRKFYIAVGFTLICCGFFAWGKLDQAGFIELSKWALAGYLGANVAHVGVIVATKELTKKE